MASDSFYMKLREEATCSLCWKYYINPCILECGHNFCVACISHCWKEFPDNTACPECRTAVKRHNCHPNILLANVVEIAKQLSSHVKDEGAWEKACARHPEPSRTAFCEDDQIIFCRACEESEQHRDHNVASVEDAVQLYMATYSSYIEVLKEKRAEMVKHKLVVAERAEQLKIKSLTAHHTMTTGFRQLHDFLVNQEDSLMMRFESVPKEIAEKSNHYLAQLSLDIFTLESNIRLLEVKASQPVHEFLQDAMETFDRCRRRPSLLPPEDFSPDLKWGLWELAEMSTTMESLANYFTDTLQNASSVERANVTLDGESNHPQLLLSPDGNSMKWTHKAVQLPNSHKRFEKLCCVVGCQEFRTGCYFWDVIVKGHGPWAVGVARSSVKRKGFFNLCVKEGVFAVGKLEREYRVINVPCSPLLVPDGELSWIRVSLNCSGGQVNFYDVTRATCIFGFNEIGSFQETFLPFFWLNGPIQLTIKQ